MKYELVLFDLDGTLTNTLSAICKIINTTMEELNLKQYSLEETGRFIGHGIQGIVEKIFEAGHYDRAVIDPEKMLEIIRKNYKKYYNYNVELYDGIGGLLDFLTENKIKMGIVTNKDHQLALETVEKNLSKWNFIEIIGAKDGEYPRKPDPYGINLISKKYSIPKSKILYAGDMSVDIRTAENAGVDVVYCNWGFGAAQQEKGINEEIRVSSPEEMIKRISYKS